VINVGPIITNREPCQTLYPPDRNVEAMESQPRMIDTKGVYVPQSQMVLRHRQKKTLRPGDIYVKNRSRPLKNGFAQVSNIFSAERTTRRNHDS
jgi:hypothetical protein